VVLDVVFSDLGAVRVITLRGEVDLATGPTLRAALLQELADGRVRIVVNLSHLAFCDSTGLSIFARFHQQCSAEGGWLRLAAPNGIVRRILDVTGVFNDMVFDTIEAASAAPDPAPPGDPTPAGAP